MSWPAVIPRTLRVASDAGARGFSFHRQPLFARELFEEHQVELTTHLLAVVVRGNLVLQRGEKIRVLREGEAALVAAGELRITEVPATAAQAADVYYCFFDDGLVRRCFHDLARTEQLANSLAAPTAELCVLPDFVPCLSLFTRAVGVQFPHGLTQTLLFTFNHGWASAWMFLKGFFARRRALHLHLEKHVLPMVSAQKIANAYPGGTRQFRRDYRAQYDVPLERWLTWRRLDLARVGLRHGRPMSIDDVAIQIGYQNVHRFRQQFRARFGLWPEEQYSHDDFEKLSQQEQARALTPFWHWGYPHAQLDGDVERAFLLRTHRRYYPRWEQRRQRRNDALIRREAIERAAQRPEAISQEAVAMDAPPEPTSGETSPSIIDLASFIKLEPFLKPTVAELAMAA